MSFGRKVRKWIANGLLVLLGLLFATVLVEILGRLAPDILPQRVQDATGLVGQKGIGGFARVQASMITGDSYLGIKLKPDVDITLEGHPDFHSYQIQTTRLGFQDIGFRDMAEDSRPAYGVAVGDSFIFGVGVNIEDTWVQVLTALAGVRFINLGLPSASTMQYTRIMKRYGLALKPRLVLYEAYAPDIQDNVCFNAWLEQGGSDFYSSTEYRHRIQGSVQLYGFLPALRQTLSRHSVVYNLIKPVLIRILRPGSTGLVSHGLVYQEGGLDFVFEQPWSFDMSKPVIQNGWHLMKNAILEAKQAADEDEVEFIVVYFPRREQAYADVVNRLAGIYPDSRLAREPMNAIRQFCDASGISFLDLTPGFRAHAKQGEQLYFRQDGHWNERGNQLAAQLIYDYLKHESLLQDE